MAPAGLVVLTLVAGTSLGLTLAGRWSLMSRGLHAAHDHVEDIQDVEERLTREIQGPDRNHDGVRDEPDR